MAEALCEIQKSLESIQYKSESSEHTATVE
jgi:hypothetical protein